MLCTNNIARCTGCTASQNHNGSKLVHIILVTQVCFTSLLRQKLQLAGFLLHLYSGSETPDFMPSVAPLQWARGERLQVPELQNYRFSLSAMLQRARLQAPGMRPHRFTYTVSLDSAPPRSEPVLNVTEGPLKQLRKSESRASTTATYEPDVGYHLARALARRGSHVKALRTRSGQSPATLIFLRSNARSYRSDSYEVSEPLDSK